MRYLLDTNVVSALRVRGRNPSVEAWAASVSVADQYLAAVAELERGVVAKERSDPAQGEVLRRWFDDRVCPPSLAGCSRSTWPPLGSLPPTAYPITPHSTTPSSPRSPTPRT